MVCERKAIAGKPALASPKFHPFHQPSTMSG
jgi:hypothetical protein